MLYEYYPCSKAPNIMLIKYIGGLTNELCLFIQIECCRIPVMYDLQSINDIIILFHQSNLRGSVYELIEHPS